MCRDIGRICIVWIYVKENKLLDFIFNDYIGFNRI